MGKCCPTSDFNPSEIDTGKCGRTRCTCLEARRQEPKAVLCSCNYTPEQCDRACSRVNNTNSRCDCTGPREHDDDCDCQACLKIGMAYLREQVELLRDKLYQRDLKVTQLSECIDALTGWDLRGDG